MYLPFHSFFAHHLTTLRRGLSYRSPSKVLFLSLSSRRLRRASRRAFVAVASSTPSRAVWAGEVDLVAKCGEGVEENEVDERVRGRGTVRREEEA